MARQYHKNPRQITRDEMTALEEDLATLGDLGGIVHDLNSDEIIGGNQRSRVFDINACDVELVAVNDEPDDQGTIAHGFVLWEGKRYSYRQVRWTERQAERANIVANKRGGSWDFDILADQFEVDDLLDWGFEPFELGMGEEEVDLGVEKGAKPNPRDLPIDAIFCWGGGDNTCCIAVRAGWMYGVRSGDVELTKGICPIVAESTRHRVDFVDNDFHDYNHAHHVAIVEKHRPKYATTRDIMTVEQCEEAGIDYYSFEQIMEWAEELEQYTDNVIVVPKYDCIGAIPEKYMLGYSVPTSYGGTPVHIDAFRGRRVHLLGGSWKAQLEHMAVLGDDVVSLDNNHINLIASSWGQFCDINGNTKQMQDIGFGNLTNVRDSAMCLSLGNIGAKINELYSGQRIPGQQNGESHE